MSKIVKEMTREELIASNDALRKENKRLNAELQAEHNLRKYHELHYGGGELDAEFE